MKPQILLIDEDPTVEGKLAAELCPGDLTFRSVTDLDGARAACAKVPFGAIVSEYDCRDGNVVEFCTWLRRAGDSNRHTPLLVLARRAEEAGRVAALEAGADDFVPKPFNAREVVLRLRRWLPKRPQPGREPAPCRLGSGILDLEGHTLTDGARNVALTPLEFRVLRTLLQQPGAVCSRALLLNSAWGPVDRLDERVVDSLIRRLRRKLRRLSYVLQTVRGFGYRLEAPGHRPS
jgi:two-component system phosphate regulon response regulator PhoB